MTLALLLQVEWKNTFHTFFQFILIFVTNIFDIWASYANYETITNQYVIDANEKYQNLSDPAIAEEYRQQLWEHVGSWAAVADKVQKVRNCEIQGIVLL